MDRVRPRAWQALAAQVVDWVKAPALSRDEGTGRLLFVGATVGPCEVQEALGGIGGKQLYRVRLVCCGTVTEKTHDQLQWLSRRESLSSHGPMCRACYSAAKLPTRALVLENPHPDEDEDDGVDLDDIRRQIDEAKAARAARVAQRRAENAARVARAHAVAMSAPPPPVLSDDILRAISRHARPSRGGHSPVSPGFEHHPRTMQDVLARAAAWHATRPSSAPMSPTPPAGA